MINKENIGVMLLVLFTLVGCATTQTIPHKNNNSFVCSVNHGQNTCSTHKHNIGQHCQCSLNGHKRHGTVNKQKNQH